MLNSDNKAEFEEVSGGVTAQLASKQQSLVTFRGIIVATGFLAAAQFASAAEATAQGARTGYEQEMGHPKPVPGVPDALRSIITSATPERIEVTSLSGQTIRLPISDMEPSDFKLLGNGRFLGFSYAAYEGGGYLILDRARADSVNTYGGDGEPVFSPDARRLAFLSSPTEMNNVLGELAIYDLLPARTVLLFSTNMLPLASDWKFERWQGNNCLIVSSIIPGWQPSDSQRLELEARTAPRMYVSVVLAPQMLVQRSRLDGTMRQEPATAG